MQTTELSDPAWSGLLSLDGAYTYSPIYQEVLTAYNRNALPVFMEESNCERGHNWGLPGHPSQI